MGLFLRVRAAMLEKTYNPAEIEKKWYEYWENSGAFKCGQRPDAETFTIVIPPPNVTGSLHIGHALDNTIQDILIRHQRLLGKDVLWQPGCDHAGIATQMVVERNLASQGLDRREMGREAFLKHVWEWKEESGGTITWQLRRLGASCDWSRERFTMDEGFSKAVLKVFVDLYRQGLLYKDQRLVNWDPKLLTAISDLEVEQKEVQGHFWHFRYPIEGEDGRYIVVATTRPETMLGDTAIAVHPDDDRYKDLVGKYVRLPLADRLIPIITDEHADPEQGSGAVKITPAHDFNDFEVGKRHELAMVNIFDQHAHLNDNVPEKYRGMERFAARKVVAADLEALGLVEKIEAKTVMMPYGDRSDVVIEPWLTDQWYVDAATLAKPAIDAVKTGATKFVPATWEKTYFNWMENIQPWCVSRQLWWGHQIPAWYDEAGKVYVAETEEEAQAEAGAGVKLTRDPDVLDTWFSSALWPFGTIGWPDEAASKELGLDRYYPNSVLVTGFDIIFFWVARMMMQGIHFMKEPPFHTVYCHGLVRDEQGQKMSKARGNTVDPLNLIEKYGADALRFTLAAMETQGRDIKLSENRIEGYRNFSTKLWNAARFCEMNDCTGGAGDFDPKSATLTVNQWIIGEVRKTVKALDAALAAYRFSEAAEVIYHFAWHSFCDWYVEFIKPVLGGTDAEGKRETQRTAAWAFDQILIMLHPFMPFITEELWHAMDEKRDSDLILGAWPGFSDDLINADAAEEMDWTIRFVTSVRSARADANIPAGAKVPSLVQGASDATWKQIERQGGLLRRLARLESLEKTGAAPAKGALQIVIDEATIILPLEGVIDLAAERDRLTKAIQKAEGEIKALSGRLGNAQFTAKAPAHVVEEARVRLESERETAAKLKAALKRLG